MAKKEKPETTPETPEAKPETRSVSGVDVYARLKDLGLHWEDFVGVSSKGSQALNDAWERYKAENAEAIAALIADAEHYVSVATADDRIAQNVARELKRVKKL